MFVLQVEGSSTAHRQSGGEALALVYTALVSRLDTECGTLQDAGIRGLFRAPVLPEPYLAAPGVRPPVITLICN